MDDDIEVYRCKINVSILQEVFIRVYIKCSKNILRIWKKTIIKLQFWKYENE